MQFSVKAVSTESSNSIAIPLRILEIYTQWDESRPLDKKPYQLLTNIFAYLIQNGYFNQIKQLLISKLPPLLEPSPVPPSPIAQWLLDMIKRPLTLVKDQTEYNRVVLDEFCRSILMPKMVDSIKEFIIPALCEFKEFPYEELISHINRQQLPPTMSLFYSVLKLEPYAFLSAQSLPTAISYLQVLARLSTVINCLNSARDVKRGNDSDSDSDSEMLVDNEESAILKESIDMLNEEQRVQGILAIVDQSNDTSLMQALCQVCHNLLINNKLAIHKYKLLYMLAFKSAFLRQLWFTVSTVSQTSLFGTSNPLLQMISRGMPLTPEDTIRVVPLLAVFCSLFSLLIATLHDNEFFIETSPNVLESNGQHAMPFTIATLVSLTAHLKSVCLGLVELAFPDTRLSVRTSYYSAIGAPNPVPNAPSTNVWNHLFKVSVELLHQLHTRDLRRQFCPEGHWIASNINICLDKPQDFVARRRRLRNYVPFQNLRAFTREDAEEGPPLSTKELQSLTLLREIPFVVPFNDRVVVFQSLIHRDKIEQQGTLTQFMIGPSIQITVRRNYLYEDAFEKLSPENEPELRLKMRVQLVNNAGLEEAGIDGGGLFREFLSELLMTSFDPNRGFFRLTKDNMLYPNPTVHLLVEDFPKHYYFIGRILGKALYENLLVELPFADFFLSKIVGLHSDVDVHHLASLDPIMYRNLLYLKSYKGDVTDLGLDFTVLSDELGERRVEELKPGGASISVTNHNRIEYIHLMADYKLNKQIRAQCFAFKQGISNVVPLDCLQLFNNKELQVLISGAQIPVDVSDLKQHTNYTGGYTADHPTINAFWKVVNEFSDLQKSQLLKFVTSCSRPPLLGFKVDF